ncbi:MAG: hypothetical protein KBS81_00850 [Spirochaetales bacterium]|nr:hypothetical protein [Candidatus Physcosoma equi]
MDVDRIYFDMDGVLANFQGGLQTLCGLEPMEQGKKTREDDDRMFAAMREYDHFYALLEPLEGAVELFHAVYDKYGDRCEILTGIPKPWRGIVHAAEDKTEWAHRLFSPDVKANAVLRKDKILFVKGKGSVLIDDYAVNIREWEANGGTGILHRNPEATRRRLQNLGIL